MTANRKSPLNFGREKLAPALSALIMAFNMSMIMFLIVTWLSLRSQWHVDIWLHAWLIAFCAAFPLILILAPIGRWVVSRLVWQPDSLH